MILQEKNSYSVVNLIKVFKKAFHKIKCLLPIKYLRNGIEKRFIDLLKVSSKNNSKHCTENKP